MSIKDINMIGPHHVCILYVTTAGLQGPLMGSDEQEIVLLIYVIVDVIQNKVRNMDFTKILPQNLLKFAKESRNNFCKRKSLK